MEILFNIPLQNNLDEYQCQFRLQEKDQRLFYTPAILLDEKIVKCLPPELNERNQGEFITSLPGKIWRIFRLSAIYRMVLSIHHLKKNLTFGYYQLLMINCSNFLTCSSCVQYSDQCLWNLQTANCQAVETKKSSGINRKRYVMNSDQCPLMYLPQSTHRLPWNDQQTLMVHIEQCNENVIVDSCQLNDHRKRFTFLSMNSILHKSIYDPHLCLLECSFQLSNIDLLHPLPLHRPIHLDLSIEFANRTSITIPRTHISVYHCERLALNCTSCLQLDSSYGCIWCNNMCMLKNQSYQLTCTNNQQCLTPMIDNIEPLLLPINGGSLVTIKGKHFDLFNLSIHLVDIPCQILEEESSENK